MLRDIEKAIESIIDTTKEILESLIPVLISLFLIFGTLIMAGGLMHMIFNFINGLLN